MTVWQTPMFRELAAALTGLLGDRTAKALRPLGLETVHDLLRHLPLHLMSGTDLTDIGQLIADYRRGVVPDQIAVVAKVLNVAVRTSNGRQRVEVVLGDRRDQLRVAFFGKPQLVRYWSDLLSSSDRGLFAGKLGWFRDQPQLAHPAFVMLMPDGRLVGTLDNMAMAKQVRKASFLGIYPQTSQVRTWTIAECLELALERIAGLPDALPVWVREEADLLDFETACRAVHQPESRDQHAAGVRRLIFDEAFGTQVAMAYRRADASEAPPYRGPGEPVGCSTLLTPDCRSSSPISNVRSETSCSPSWAVTAPCSDYCRVRSAPARPWWRCGRCWRSSTPVARPSYWRQPRCWLSSTTSPP